MESIIPLDSTRPWTHKPKYTGYIKSSYENRDPDMSPGRGVFLKTYLIYEATP